MAQQMFEYAPAAYYGKTNIITGTSGSAITIEPNKQTKRTEQLWSTYRIKGLELTKLYKLKTLLNKQNDNRVIGIDKAIRNFKARVALTQLK